MRDTDPALGAALRVAMEQDVQPLSTDAYRSVPWPSSVHADPFGGGRGHWPWRARHARPVLVSMIFDLYHARGTMPRRAVGLRQALWTSCIHAHRRRRHAVRCQHAAMSAPQPGLPPRANLSAIVVAYNASVFCVQPSAQGPHARILCTRAFFARAHEAARARACTHVRAHTHALAALSHLLTC